MIFWIIEVRGLAASEGPFGFMQPGDDKSGDLSFLPLGSPQLPRQDGSLIRPHVSHVCFRRVV